MRSRLAIATAAFVLAACSGTTQALHQVTPAPSQASPSPSSSASPPASPSPSASPTSLPISSGNVLLSMRMTSLSIMWAATNNHVLRSTDAGRHWSEVTPRGGGDFSTFFAVDDGAAWIVHSDFNVAAYTVWRTVDAGATWRAFTGKLPGGSVTNVYFVDRLHGWITDNLGAAAGSEGVAIIRTTDGGATWTVIARSNDPSANQGASGIEFGCDKGAAVFGSIEVGLLPTSCATNQQGIYRTTDAGVHWSSVDLPASGGIYGDYYVAPIFLTATDAVLSGQTVVAVTHDGGATWTAYRLPGTGSIDFATTASGWQLNSSLWSTSDGGRSWQTIGGTPPFKSTDMTLQYLGRGIAIAFAYAQTSAYRTDDGGRTWRSVAPAGLVSS